MSDELADATVAAYGERAKSQRQATLDALAKQRDAAATNLQQEHDKQLKQFKSRGLDDA